MHYLAKYDVFFIFVLIFVIYNITTRLAINGDTVPASILPFIIIAHQTVYFDPIFGQSGTAELTYQYILTNGHYASIFPIVTPILVTPLYLLHSLFLAIFPGDLNYTSLLAKHTASLLATLAGVFVYLTSKKLFKFEIAVLTTFIFAFGTLTWSISAQALWQHGVSELLLAIALFCIVRNEIKQSAVNFIVLGVISGLFVFNRPPDGLLLIPVLYYVYLNREHVYSYVGCALLSGVPFLTYNVVTFSNIFGGYGENANSVISGIGNPIELLIHFIGLLISPSRGIFIYSPILIFGIIGFYMVYTSNERYTSNASQKKNISGFFNETIKNVFLIFIPVIIGTILIYSAFSPWFGGWCFGPRFLTGFLPVLAIFTGYGIDRTIWSVVSRRNKQLISLLVLILFIISIINQAIGAWAYPYTDWDKDVSDHKIWDWSDTQIVASIKAAERDFDMILLLLCPSIPPPIGIVPLYIRQHR